MSYVPCIMPGFNNTLLYESGENKNWLLVDRDASKYAAGIHQLAEYVDPVLRMLYLHTWNDLQEGTSIEPTVEYGLDFIEAVYTGLTGTSTIPELYTPKTYAEEWIELAESAITQNRTMVDTRVLQLAQNTLSQAHANFTSGNFRDATALAIDAYRLMSTQSVSGNFPIEVLLTISVVGLTCVVVVVLKLKKR